MTALEKDKPHTCTSGSKRPAACVLCDVREQSICSDLKPDDLALAEKVMARRLVAKGAALLSEGLANDQLFVIIHGSFRMVSVLEDGRRQVTGFLFPGDFLGVTPIEAAPFSAEALEDSIVCAFPHGFLKEAGRSSPGMKDRLIARGQTELHKAQSHIVLLGRKTAEERILSFLEDLAVRTGAETDDGRRVVHLPMPRQDIADYLGLRHETLSRTLAGLKASGRIAETSRHSITLAAAERTG